MSFERDGGEAIQAMPIGRGNAISPYTVVENDEFVEFTEAGDVTCTLAVGSNTTTTVLAGARYALDDNVLTIAFSGTFSIA